VSAQWKRALLKCYSRLPLCWETVTMMLRCLILSVVACGIGTASLQAQTQTGGGIKETALRQVAADLYFLYDQTSSNSAFLVTDDGVLVVDTRQHPRDRMAMSPLRPT